MATNNPVLLFDGVCNFCNNMVNFAIRNDRKGKLKFTPLQSETARKLIQQHKVSTSADTIVFITNNKAYTYANAAIRVCKYLDWPARLLYIFIIVPSFISQPLYKWFARHRYKWFGRKETCMVPTASLKERFLD